MPVTVERSSSLRKLAHRFIDLLGEDPLRDPFGRECIVVGSRPVGAWLQQEWLYDRPPQARQRVLAQWDIQYLHVFVNDWIDPRRQTGERAARLHPYSFDALRWRLYSILGEEESGVVTGPVRAYLGPSPDPARVFSLAGELARLYDRYQLHRPKMLQQWQRRTPGNDWQARLWHRLLAREEESYLALFERMGKTLAQSEIATARDRISVFAPTAMPPVYIEFFRLLGERLPLYLFLFDPCEEPWIDPRASATGGALALEGLPRQSEKAQDDSLLHAWGSGLCEFLGEIALRLPIEGNILSVEAPSSPSLLDLVQEEIRRPNADPAPRMPRDAGEDLPAMERSLSIQVCHGPLREAEILRDQILGWFAANPDCEPRHIGVQVADMATYLPYIHAVFGSAHQNAPESIPYAVADRTVLGSSSVARAFLDLLALPESRFAAPEILRLLDCEPLATAFGLDANAVVVLREWIEAANIRWGQDADHRRRVLGTDPGPLGDLATWRRGIDRMLLGYALGSSGGTEAGEPVAAGALGGLLPCDFAEGGGAALLGRLADVFQALQQTTETLSKPRSLPDWRDCLLQLLDRFLPTAGISDRDIIEIREHVDGLLEFGELAREPAAIPIRVIAHYFEDLLQEADSGDALLRNAVVFSALRPMSSTPRPIVCILGLNDGVFPRGDTTPAFDRMREGARRCDPSLRRGDRQAFLEAVLSAEETLYLSYTGRDERSNESLPPSTVLQELIETLEARTGNAGIAGLVKTEHRLQAFHPGYFAEETGLYSYSRPDLAAARALLAPSTETAEATAAAHPQGAPAQRDARETISLSELIRIWINPARHYYQSRLQVRFDEPAEHALQESEQMTPGSLEAYQLCDLIQTGLRDGTSAPALRSAALDRGLLPPGSDGRAEFEQTWQRVQSALLSELPGTGLLLRDVLAGEGEPVHIALDLAEAGNMEATVALHRAGGACLHVAFRPASVKAKDRLCAGLAHLALCAAEGTASFRSLLLGVNGGLLETETLPLLDVDEARTLLAAILEQTRAATEKPLPFAPETAFQYQRATDSENADEDSAVREARKIWNGDRYRAGESRDPYLKRAFGEAGPLADPDFGPTAELLYGWQLDDEGVRA